MLDSGKTHAQRAAKNPSEKPSSLNCDMSQKPNRQQFQQSLVSGLLLCGLALLSSSGCKKEDPSSPSPSIISVVPAPAPTPAPPAPVAPQAAVSAEPSSFDEVAAQLDRGGSFYAYVSTEKWFAGLAAQLGNWREIILSAPAVSSPADRQSAEAVLQLMTNLYTRSGLDRVTGVGASSFAVEPGLYRSKLFIHHRTGKGDGLLASAFGKTPHPLTALDLLPADTALAGFADFDLTAIVPFLLREIGESGVPEAKKGLDQALKEFPAAAGMTLDEALASLGGSLGFILTLDPAKPLALPIPGQKPAQKLSIPTPRAALLVQVRDDRIFQRIDQLIAAQPGLVKVDETGLRLRTLPSPVPPPFALRPTVAQWGGYLILATDDTLVRDLIAAKTTGRGYKSTAEFAKLAGGLPVQGNGFQLATAALGEAIARLQRELVKGQPGTTPAQFAMLEKLLGNQKAGATYAVTAHLPNGWLAVGKGSQGAGQLLAPAVIVPVAIGAGLALPVFSKVRGRGNATKSLSNAKQIGTACKLYALDNDGKFPPNLAALIPDYLPEAAIFVSPFAPGEPAGYSYRAGLTEKSPPKTVLLEDKFAGREKQRVVVRVDGSGEVLPAP